MGVLLELVQGTSFVSRLLASRAIAHPELNYRPIGPQVSSEIEEVRFTGERARLARQVIGGEEVLTDESHPSEDAPPGGLSVGVESSSRFTHCPADMLEAVELV